MAKLLNKMLNFVGWETEEEEEMFEEDEIMKDEKEEVAQPQFLSHIGKKQPQAKVVNIHTANQFKVVIMQPEAYDDAQDVCEHLKSKKPIIVNLEDLEKETAQRIIDFLSGSVYALDGNIQKVSNGIFIVAPCNVDIMGDFQEEITTNKAVFPWMR